MRLDRTIVPILFNSEKILSSVLILVILLRL